MSVIYSENSTHRANLLAAEHARQIAYAGAAGSQAAVTTADIVHFRACLASAKANGCGTDIFVTALKSLNTGGS
jgi:hypothetical protein